MFYLYKIPGYQNDYFILNNLLAPRFTHNIVAASQEGGGCDNSMDYPSYVV